jgi:myo-inositol-hexaphosphate 3-phosphohydrolase
MRSSFALLGLFAAIAQAQPARVPFSGETLPIPGNQAGDTAILTDRFGGERSYVFGTDAVNNGLYGFLVDGGSGYFVGFGPVGGVDAVPFVTDFSGTTGGLIAASATNAGGILFFTTLPDGGVRSAGTNLQVIAPRAVAIADFGDAGAHLFYDTGTNQLQHARLFDDGGVVVAVADAPIRLPFFARAIAVSPQRRRAYVSAGFGGVFEIDVVSSTPSAVQIIDGGSSPDIAGGLAVYPQRDGGALLLAALPSRDLIRVFRLGPGTAEPLGDFAIAGPDGGRLVRGAEFIDVWPGPFGGPPDGGAYPKGVFVICDRQSIAGANYKLVRWEDFALAAMPALPIDVPGDDGPVSVGPPTVPVGVTIDAPGQSTVDVAWWPGPDRLLATTNGVSVREPVGATVTNQLALDGGSALGVASVDALVRLGLGPVLAVTISTPDAGAVLLLGRQPDGGFRLELSLPSPRAESVLVADLKDAGVYVFAATTAQTLERWPLTRTDAGALQGGPRVDRALQLTPHSITLLPTERLIAFTSGNGLFTVDPFAGLPPVAVVDAGAPLAGVATYPQADGGSLLLVALPSLNRFRVYSARTAPFPLLAEFALVQTDGGAILSNAAWVDVVSGPMGRVDGGTARWPEGVVAVGASTTDGGALYLVDWGSIARSATPRLPIDSPVSSEAGGGSSGGQGGGGTTGVGGGVGAGRPTGGGGGGIVQPPKGCCAGAPSDFALPAIAFMLWLARFRRRQP